MNQLIILMKYLGLTRHDFQRVSVKAQAKDIIDLNRDIVRKIYRLENPNKITIESYNVSYDDGGSDGYNVAEIVLDDTLMSEMQAELTLAAEQQAKKELAEIKAARELNKIRSYLAVKLRSLT